MFLKDIYEKLKQEIKVLKGEESKDKTYCSDHIFATENEAQDAFRLSVRKLFDVNKWSDLKGLNSTFELHDEFGRRSYATKPETGYFMRIDLPGPTSENWVIISGISESETHAEFVVHPSKRPSEKHDPTAETKHFFTEEARSIFRVELHGRQILACEIGRNEFINNQEEEAGNRAALNTLIAEGGWAGFQGFQWNKLTDYLVHNEEAES